MEQAEPSLGRHQKRGRATREKLLNATLKTLIQRGYAGCSMPELCKRAGLSRGAQLHHFPTKELLLTSAIEHLMQTRQQQLRDAMATLQDEQRADAFVDELWRIYSGDVFYAWLEIGVAARTDKKLRKHLQAVNDRFYEQAHETLLQLLPLNDEQKALAPVLARFITSFMDGVAVNRILDDDDAMTDATLELFKAGVRQWVAMLGPGGMS